MEYSSNFLLPTFNGKNGKNLSFPKINHNRTKGPFGYVDFKFKNFKFLFQIRRVCLDVK